MSGVEPWGGAPFGVLLPAGARDASTYAFVLPTSRKKFSPSLVVKTDRLLPEGGLAAYVAEQLAQLQAKLADFELRAPPVAEARQDGRAMLRVDVAWGRAPRRFFQDLRAIDVGGRVLLVTTTRLADSPAEDAAALEAAARSVSVPGVAP